MKNSCIVVLKRLDGTFVSAAKEIDLMGYRASEIWFFGSFSNEKEKALYIQATKIAAACDASFCQIS